jgi:hypothetical protein
MNSEEAAKQRRRAAILRGVQDQLESPETPEVRFHYQRLLSLGYSDSEARELIATLLAFYFWHVQRGDAYTYADYVAELEQLPEIDWEDDGHDA